MFKNKLPLIIGQAELMFWQFCYMLRGGGGFFFQRGRRGKEGLYLLCKLRLRGKKSLLKVKVSNRYIYPCSKSKSQTDMYIYNITCTQYILQQWKPSSL